MLSIIRSTFARSGLQWNINRICSKQMNVISLSTSPHGTPSNPVGSHPNVAASDLLPTPALHDAWPEDADDEREINPGITVKEFRQRRSLLAEKLIRFATTDDEVIQSCSSDDEEKKSSNDKK